MVRRHSTIIGRMTKGQEVSAIEEKGGNPCSIN
jgi:hypothetical protein